MVTLNYFNLKKSIAMHCKASDDFDLRVAASAIYGPRAEFKERLSNSHALTSLSQDRGTNALFSTFLLSCSTDSCLISYIFLCCDLGLMELMSDSAHLGIRNGF